MSTIIERIAAAEADAETIRRNAVESARAARADAEEEAARSLRTAREEVKTELALAASLAARDGKAQSQAVLKDRALAIQAEMNAAAKKMDKAVDAIVGSIIEGLVQ